MGLGVTGHKPSTYHAGRYSVFDKTLSKYLTCIAKDLAIDFAPRSDLRVWKSAPGVSGESLETSVACRCPNGTQFLSYLPILKAHLLTERSSLLTAGSHGTNRYPGVCHLTNAAPGC
ncbi:hypothetical protein TNCV_167761 [Trichonephila clavipes]|nr:hypothetical protein TNCV_167761 [Trichonephila clavipes]